MSQLTWLTKVFTELDSVKLLGSIKDEIGVKFLAA